MMQTSTATGSGTLRQLISALLSRLPELAHDLARRIEDANQANGYRERVSGPDLLDSCHANLERILQVLADALPAGVDPLDAPRASGRRRAVQGIPLEAVLHAYRLGTATIWQALLTEARSGPPGSVDVVTEATSSVLDIVNRYSLVVADAYRATEAELGIGDADRHGALMDALLTGTDLDPATAAAAATALDLPPHDRFAVVALRYDATRDRPLTVPRDALAVRGVRSAWRTTGDREFGVLALGGKSLTAVAALLEPLLPRPAGLSWSVAGLGSLAEARRAAETALSTAPARSPRVYRIDDRLPEAMVVSRPDLAHRLTERVLGRLLEQTPAERRLLVDTLEVWLRGGRSVAAAAVALHCHRNTVANRLRRIETLTGGSLDDDRHVLCCYLALTAVRLLPADTSLATPAPGLASAC
ncbi:PucR family transcriptional regulator [Actinoplanes sp. NPDC049681]|uniref:PucR family transcriptional regulator n=1 Tax=Actinoplanes sp. NPDC049681 TaxID=3363905 RepID=UPI00378B9C5D